MIFSSELANILLVLALATGSGTSMASRQASVPSQESNLKDRTFRERKREMAHPLTGSWRLVWNEFRGVRYPTGHTPAYMSKLSMNALPTYPCIVTGLNQHIDVERRLWIDSMDLFIPDTETAGRWTVFGNIAYEPSHELPAPLEVSYEYGSFEASESPSWLKDFTGRILKLQGTGKASTIQMTPTHRLDRDSYDRRAYLERIDSNTELFQVHHEKIISSHDITSSM